MLRTYNDTLSIGYGIPRDWLAIFDAPDTLEIHGIAFYLGYLDGVPVATSMRVTSHRIAGIYNVATLPEYWQRGLGAALTWRVVLDGRDEGCLASGCNPPRLASHFMPGWATGTSRTIRHRSSNSLTAASRCGAIACVGVSFGAFRPQL